MSSPYTIGERQQMIRFARDEARALTSTIDQMIRDLPGKDSGRMAHELYEYSIQNVMQDSRGGRGSEKAAAVLEAIADLAMVKYRKTADFKRMSR